MRIIAHRGYWKTSAEKNTITAFTRALDLGYGIETDIRDFDETLVISHDIPSDRCLKVTQFFTLLSTYPAHELMAFNIKSDGLQTLLSQAISAHEISNYFLFDMSIPDTYQYTKYQLPFALRVSEFEEPPSKLMEKCEYIWLDAFESDWYNFQHIKSYLEHQKQVIVVSPELHHRDYMACWQCLKENNLFDNPNLAICTDYPEDADNYFNGQN